jgi:hypothetical protein
MFGESRSLGENIDHLWEIREEIRGYDERIAELKKAYAAAEEVLMVQLAEEHTPSASGVKATASVAESVVPKVEDWEAFYRYIHRNNAYHLLERRPAAAAFRELLEQRKGKDIPGVVPYTKRTLKLLTRT